MAFALSQRSLDKLQGVHPDLVDVVKLAIKLTPIDFMVIEGLRTMERQRELVRKGASKTLNSRHLDGHAVDIVPLDNKGQVSWDWPLYYQIAPAIKQAAEEIGVQIEWGGDWRTFKDGPHWQLPFDAYPKGTAHYKTIKAKPYQPKAVPAVPPTGSLAAINLAKAKQEAAGVGAVSSLKSTLIVRLQVLQEEVSALRYIVDQME